MPRRDWKLRIQDILDCIEKIQRYTAGVPFDGFASNELLIDAVLRNFITIGEAASRVPADVHARHFEVQWSKMWSMRNVIAHQYHRVDLQVAWQTIQEDLPIVAAQRRTMLQGEL